jgi:hypothetical protein
MGGPHAGRNGNLGGYDGEVCSFSGDSKHYVYLYPVTGMKADGDPRVSEYPEVRESFDTERVALQAVPELIRGLGQ